MSRKSNEDMKYLAMRAKKMVGRLTNSELPSPQKLQENFERKGVRISDLESKTLLREIKIARGIIAGHSAFGEEKQEKPERTEKPRVKAEVAPAPVHKTSTSWGK